MSGPVTEATKPLFVPLKGEYFDAFASGAKNTEYRLYGKRWNERTCRIGRAVTLSRGYSGARLRGHVSDFFVLAGCRSADFLACYQDAVDAQMACIQIRLEAA